MSRSPLAVSAAGGSFGALAWQFLVDHWGNNQNPPFACDCPVWPTSSSGAHFHLDWVSLGLGICIGFALGPVVEVVVLVRQLWVAAVRRQVAAFARTTPVFRVV